MLNRRELLRLAALSAAGSALPRAALAERKPPAGAAIFYVPGNAQSGLYVDGVKMLENPRATRDLRPFDGHPALVTRLSEVDRSVVRNLLPVAGHDISVKADGSHAVCNGQNATTMCSFDPATLRIDVFIEYEEGILGGGHSVYLPDGSTMAVTERKPYDPFTGNPKDHYGFLSIRDNDSLDLIERYSCGGITPHDISLLDGGTHVVLSNYGSTSWPEGSYGYDNYHVEPSVCVIELASGKIVHRYAPPLQPKVGEFRHLAGRDPSRIFVIQNTEMAIGKYHEMMAKSGEIYRPVLQKTPYTVGSSLPVVHVDFESGEDPPARYISTPDPSKMLRAQSVAYDPTHDEALATFPLSDSVVAVSGKTGETRVIDTAVLGLETPRGIDVLPDGTHYAVAGDHGNVFVFECGTHRLVRERCFYEPLYRHSHMTAA